MPNLSHSIILQLSKVNVDAEMSSLPFLAEKSSVGLLEEFTLSVLWLLSLTLFGLFFCIIM
jgi:hypothetical protein